MPTRFSGGDIPTPVIGGHPVPPFLLRPISPPVAMPRDAVGNRIATLMALHPGIAARYPEVDLSRMDADARRIMLDRMNADLGIRPVRKRTLDLSW